MSAENFRQSLAFTLQYEGGKVDDKNDPGGRTNQGITQRVYDEYRKDKRLSLQDVYLMSNDERDAIYRVHYWEKAGCDFLPAGVDYAVFDYAVNSGVGRAVKTLQVICGLKGSQVDGGFGPTTRLVVTEYVAMHGETSLSDEICAQRVAFLKTLPAYARYGRGWSRRVMGDMDGRQETDTGVIDRAYSMSQHTAVQRPEDTAITPKTYLVS